MTEKLDLKHLPNKPKLSQENDILGQQNNNFNH